jgi:glutamyl-tRNA reductase
VILAEAECGSLEGRSIAVVGAGSMARGVVDFALGREVGSVTVLNRTVARAEALAGEHGRWGSLDELHEVLTHVDVVVTATSSPDPVLDVEDLAPVVALREGRLLVVIDLAVPRNVGAGVASVDGVVLHDMDALGRFADAGLDSRRREVPAVEAIVDAEVDRYISARAARQVAPLVAALHRRGDEVIEAELQRGASRLAGLGDADRAAMEATLRAVVSKLLHDPTVRLKDAAGSPRGDRLAGSLRELFGL